MAAPKEAEVRGGAAAAPDDAGIYLDASAFAKLYLPEAESERLDVFLQGRRGLIVSDLVITEVLAAVARRKRERELHADQAHEIRDAVLADADSGSFERPELTPSVHREAERLLLKTDSQPLRALDALHIALALSISATHVITFDRRMREAALQAGLKVIDV